MYYEKIYHHSTPLAPSCANGESTTMLNSDTTESEGMFLQCVDPHLVYPMNSCPHSASVSDQCMVNVESPHKSDKPQSEMERFNNLSLSIAECAAKHKSQTSNELNTPIFEGHEEFDFAAQASSPEMWDSLKFTNELFEFPTNNVKYVGANTMIESNNNSVVDKTILYPVKAEEVYNKQVETPVYIETHEHDYDGSRNCYSDVTSVGSPPHNVELDSLDDSRSLNSDCPTIPPTNLQLNIGIKLFQDSISTPDIIDAISGLESTFNIFTTEKEPADIVKLEEDLKSLLSEPAPSESPSESPRSEPSPPMISEFHESHLTVELNQSVPTSTQQKRRRKNYDSDEDYVPPKRSRKAAPQSECAFSSDSEEEFIPTQKKRGRPPGRRSSTVSHISSVSTCSNETNVDRYRELRDKNNEASRKSRAKRRVKEQQITTEADNLYDKNIKLKAQVEELERTIKSYKDNLFKFVLTK